VPDLESIFTPSEDGESSNRLADAHGVFLASGLVFLGTLAESALVSYLKPGTERFFLLVATGLILFAFMCGGLALRYQQLWMMYVLFCVPLAIGSGLANLMAVLIFLQWFDQMGSMGIGAGIFGFLIGAWPALFSLAGQVSVVL
jgi:hypothetical protein